MQDVIVSRITHEAEGVVGVELRPAAGSALAPFVPGAHVDLHLPGGLCRQYSLTNGPDDTERYCLGIGLARNSRGGSRHIHERLRVGDSLQVSVPRSLFGIDRSASEHLFIAGGIGITPILSMIKACEDRLEPWRLLYCVRSRATAAYLWDLAAARDRVQLHVDEDRGQLADFRVFLGQSPAGAHVYCCGPAPLMTAVEEAAKTAGIPAESLHFERFSAPEVAPPAGGDRSFVVKLQRSGISVTVEPGHSILECLEAQGVAVPCSCREGLCRTCETALVSGEADHRDFVLSEAERAANGSVILCVSRAKSEELILDL